MADEPEDTGDPLVARSFVARALLEPGTATRPARRWYGIVTDAQSGLRRLWRRPSEVARFIEDSLAADPAVAAGAGRAGGPVGAALLRGPGVGPGGSMLRAAVMSAPSLDDVVGTMLTVLGERLPPPGPVSLPAANVTVETVAERSVGLGDHVGTELAGALGPRTVRGGRLDARVRFQVWAAGPAEADGAMASLHSTLLDDADELRGDGFLRFAPAGTTLAEHVSAVPGWRKTSSYDVLFEYRFDDADDAASLIARIPVTGDTEVADGPGREVQTVTDHLVRWDQEGAAPLVVTGPVSVTWIETLTFTPGVALGGLVTVTRTSGGAPSPVADLDTFLAAAAGGAEVEVGLAPASFFAALGTPTTGPVLGDWDVDGVGDAYVGAVRAVTPPLRLEPADRLEFRYTPPAGPAPGLDRTAVVYLRVGAS